MTGTATVIHGNARHLPLADDTVDLVVTSPPYFALRSYQDGGLHYDGQIGSEPMPAEFVDALIEVTRECMRVLKPSGSLWVNLGDKYANSPPSLTSERVTGLSGGKSFRSSRDRQTRDFGIRTKSLIGIPWRYALRCIDDLGLILRAEVIWSKPNGLPESVTDRVRRSHEQWFHFTLNPRYYSAVDEIREPQVGGVINGNGAKRGRGHGGDMLGSGTFSKDGGFNAYREQNGVAYNPLGKLPGSVWQIPTEPLTVPDHLGVDHFAAFPSEWPKRIIAGWSPAGVCTACGDGRRPVSRGDITGDRGGRQFNPSSGNVGVLGKERVYTITGYACACPEPTAPTTPGVVLDVFGGTGTTAMVAKALGRHGITVDMSSDYCRLARWRVNDLDQLAKAQGIKRSDAARAADSLDMDGLFDMEPTPSASSLGGGLAYANKNGRDCSACGYRSQYATKPICEKCGAESERAS